MTVTKSWNDENNKDGIRPDSVKVSLLADGKDTGKSITLDKGNNWTDTFKNLDKKVNDKDVTYSVKENDVSGYEATSTSTDATHITIINKHTPKSVTPSDNKRTFTVIKKWADDNNADSTRPSEIKVQLTANGKNVGDPVTLNAKGGWTKTWSDLDKQENGKDITYSVKEIKVPGYTTKTVTKDGLATITNTLNHVTPPVDNKTNLTVTKTWNDKNNQDKIRPDQVKVQLLADGKNTGDPVILNADNDWSYTWNNLDKNAKYSVKETPVTGYTTEVKQVDDNNISIINTHSTNTPVNPGKPGNPDKPTTPTNPTIPTTPTEPEQPTEPSNPNTSTDTDLIPSESNNNESTSTDSTPLLPDNPLTPAKASDPNTSNEDVTKGLLPQTGNQTTWILSLLGLIVLIGLGFYELIRKLA
ncbi:hypothetical protein LBO01_08540 [Companilactobacillus paralimentarius]|uniref:Collagen adhesin n=3 Tax=Companilactobacillus bobalius TaxID=2801451 RepID=A0A202FB38_9LACO|nr:Collagen adhesin [Companilactobacillus bobalius DSM 19674]OVE97662.1 Collagen adhesin [Companilactobacillus bobalius]GEO57725.1 hypothetical protein LBO01_08540 [Companilactobacillus paralimentarius]